MKRKSNVEKELDIAIEREWYRQASGVQVDIMDIPKIFKTCKDGVKTSTVPLSELVATCIVQYRKN